MYLQLEDVENVLCVCGINWDIGGEVEVGELRGGNVVVVLVDVLFFYSGVFEWWVIVVVLERRALSFLC